MAVRVIHNGWPGIRQWLRSSDSDWFHDECVWGSLPRYEAEELLADFALPVTKENLRVLWQEVDASLMEGR